MNFLTQAVSESDGNPSTMRIATLLVVGCVMGVWVTLSIKAGTIQPLSPEQVAAVLGALGLKAWQRGREGDATAAPAPPKA